MNIYGEFFYGNKISDYGLENGYLDYATLAKSFDAVLNNSIFSMGWELGEWEQVSGYSDYSTEIEEAEEQLQELQEAQDDNAEEIAELEMRLEELQEMQDRDPEIFQFYIVSDQGAEILQEAGEIVFYNAALDIYLWGVTHYGTAWGYVLTDIPCNTGRID